MNTLLLAGWLIWLFDLAMLIRNSWVYKQRQALNAAHSRKVRVLIYQGELDHPLVAKMDENWFDKDYLSYYQMMCRFWIWDVEKLRRKRNTDVRQGNEVA